MFVRIWNLLFGWIGLGITSLEKKNPSALLNRVQEDMRKDVANYNAGLISHAKHVEELNSQTKRLERAVRDNTAKVSAFVKAGNTNAAKPLALQLQKDKESLAENQTQLQTANATYQQLVIARDAAIQKAKDTIGQIKNDLSEKQRGEALANLTETANGMISQIGGHADTLNRLSEIAAEGKNAANARLKVAAGSLATGDAQSYIQEQDALGDAALASFMAEQGIAPAGASAPAADKASSMGVTEPAATTI
jgi:phage shock protein A